MKDKWEELHKWIEEYRDSHTQPNNWSEFGRYEIAISCNNLLEKMHELEEKS